MQTMLEILGGGAPANNAPERLLKKSFGFTSELFRFKKHILPCHPEGETRRILKENSHEILRQEQILSLSCVNHAQKDKVFKIGINTCHPEGGARRILKENSHEILHQEQILSLSCVSHAQNDMVFKIGTNPCHPEDKVRRISKKNEQKILHFVPNDKKCAFTLAEVLITLGVIGIVAAMTLPSLISNWRYKQLETAFKKAYSVHSSALSLVKAEVGVDNLRAEFTQYDRVSQSYSRANEFISLYNDKLHVIGKCVYNEKIRNYNNTDDAYVDIGTTKIDYMLPDGSCYKAVVNGAEVSITIDINGAGAKPNRFGHDIFVFRVDTKGMLSPVKMSKLYTDEELEDNYSGQPAMSAQVGDPCSIKSKQKGNGMGCAWYAFNDINPDDNSKRYWENLPK